MIRSPFSSPLFVSLIGILGQMLRLWDEALAFVLKGGLLAYQLSSLETYSTNLNALNVYLLQRSIAI